MRSRADCRARRAGRRGPPLMLLVALEMACSASSPPVTGSVSTARAEEPRRQGSTRAGHHSLALGASRVEVALVDREHDGASRPLLTWVSRAARAVETFYEGFPVPDLLVQLHAMRRPGIRHGRVVVRDRPVIIMSVGARTLSDHFERDWRMTHEMVHLAFPNVPDRHHWLEEGLATYVEPIARARTGWISEDAVWLEWLENMPLGLRRPGEGGLDGTDSWARTYWGGALFCLVTDVELRRRTRGRRGLPHALRAIVEAGGNLNHSWSLARVIRVGDQATGQAVIGEQYQRLAARAGDVDLAGLWRDLGVSRQGDGVHYDDDAPLAQVRRALVMGPGMGPVVGSGPEP